MREHQPRVTGSPGWMTLIQQQDMTEWVMSREVGVSQPMLYFTCHP